MRIARLRKLLTLHENAIGYLLRVRDCQRCQYMTVTQQCRSREIRISPRPNRHIAGLAVIVR